MTGTTPLASLPGPLAVVGHREGLLDGALIASRVLGSVGIVLVLCTFTPAHEIFAALRWARVPRTWIEIAMLMYRSIFTPLRAGRQRARGAEGRLGYATLRRSLRSLGSLAGHRDAAVASTRPSGRTRPWWPAATKVACRCPTCRRFGDSGQRPSRRSPRALIAVAYVLAERWSSVTTTRPVLWPSKPKRSVTPIPTGSRPWTTSFRAARARSWP